ncbi:hypothetical protein MRX96_049368 [Rhipicephalus microplus]
MPPSPNVILILRFTPCIGDVSCSSRAPVSVRTTGRVRKCFPVFGQLVYVPKSSTLTRYEVSTSHRTRTTSIPSVAASFGRGSRSPRTGCNRSGCGSGSGIDAAQVVRTRELHRCLSLHPAKESLVRPTRRGMDIDRVILATGPRHTEQPTAKAWSTAWRGGARGMRESPVQRFLVLQRDFSTEHQERRRNPHHGVARAQRCGIIERRGRACT